MKRFPRWLPVGMLALVLALGACATPPKPFVYRSENDLKSGPGLFSGEDGRFTIYGEPDAVRGSASPRSHDQGAEVPVEPAPP